MYLRMLSQSHWSLGFLSCKYRATLLALTATGGATALLITLNPHVYVSPPHTTNGSSTVAPHLNSFDMYVVK